MEATRSIAALLDVLPHPRFLFLPVRMMIQPGWREVDNLKFWQAIFYFIGIFGPDHSFALVPYCLPTLLAHSTLDLFVAPTLTFINDQLVEIRLCLKAEAQLAAVQVEQAFIEIMQRCLEDVAIKTRSKAAAEQFIFEDATLKLAAATETVEQSGCSNACTWKVWLELWTLLHQQRIYGTRSCMRT